ncbi:MAG TPA: hypothetical protein VGK15_05800 [Candidatus Limnocylindria bacterium]
MSTDREDQPLPLRATGIFLGLWITALLVLAFFVVPMMFASCLPSGAPLPSPSP